MLENNSHPNPLFSFYANLEFVLPLLADLEKFLNFLIKEPMANLCESFPEYLYKRAEVL